MAMLLLVPGAALLSAALGHASRWVRLHHGTGWLRVVNGVAVLTMLLLLDRGGAWVPVAFAVGVGCGVGSLVPPLLASRLTPRAEPTGSSGPADLA